ncbi:MAG: translation initiation factor IF-3 [Patescibacteria group bacterium]
MSIKKIRYRVNQFIRVPEIQLIDETGKPHGVVSTYNALEMAREAGLDLVEVNPKARPSIAKIMDFGQFQYRQQKMERQQKVKAKKTEIKGIRLSLNIGKHDLEVRKVQAEKFLSEGNQVRLEIILRGREKARGDLAQQVFNNFVTSLGDEVVVQVPFSRQGGRLSMQIGRKSGNAGKSAVKLED